MTYRNRLLAALAACAAMAGLARGADVTITSQNRLLDVSTPAMDVLISPDGSMSSWRIGPPGDAIHSVANIVKTGTALPDENQIGGSRGAFFYQDGPVELSDVKVDGDHSIVASGERASIRYDFEAAHMRWTLLNKTDQPMQFLMIFDPNVRAVSTGAGVFRATPVLGLWTETTWFQSRKKFTITGGSRVWGPGLLTGQTWKQGNLQVWEAILAPKESRVVDLTAADATPEELSALSGIAPEVPFRSSFTAPLIAPKPAFAGNLTLYSPCDYRVFQRKSARAGSVRVSGEVKVPCDELKAHLTGKDGGGIAVDLSPAIAVDPATHAFSAEVAAPAGGWYQLEVTALQGGKEVAAAKIPHVGVGEVFVTSGQSNSTSCGFPPTVPQSGMVATFGGDDWRLANDPQPGARDPGTGGSPWPSFGDAMFARYHVPIGIAVTGHGGAPVRVWAPGSVDFVWVMARINELGPGGFRALLWHQGESDSATPADVYVSSLASTIAASYAAAGWKFPWFVAQTSMLSPGPPVPSTREAQKRLWDTGVALEGPDTDTITPEFRVGFHMNAQGLKKHGELWADKVSVYLDKVLAQP